MPIWAQSARVLPALGGSTPPRYLCLIFPACQTAISGANDMKTMTIQSAINASKQSVRDELKSVFTFINLFNADKKSDANKYILNLLGVKKLTINELYAINVDGTFRFQKLQDVTRRLNCEWTADVLGALGSYVTIGKKTYQAVPVATTKGGFVSYVEFYKSLEAACMIAEERQKRQEELKKVFAKGAKPSKITAYDRALSELKEKYSDVEPSMLEAIAAKAAAAAIAGTKVA